MFWKGSNCVCRTLLFMLTIYFYKEARRDEEFGQST